MQVADESRVTASGLHESKLRTIRRLKISVRRCGRTACVESTGEKRRCRGHQTTVRRWNSPAERTVGPQFANSANVTNANVNVVIATRILQTRTLVPNSTNTYATDRLLEQTKC